MDIGAYKTDRYDEIISLIPEDSVRLVKRTVREVVYLEDRMDELKTLPFIRYNPSNPTQQKTTPAFKMYKESLQQYTNCIKLLEAVIYRDKRLDGAEAEESPLRRWFRENTK